ncbi:MAG: LacI family DNA-binding transcriptional regulator [Jiangellaceae bacterium]
MTDVARLAGVSQKTVSRVINNAPNVSADVRDRVNAAVAALGYRRNSAARALVTQRTSVIGIVTPGTALYGPSAQLFGVERAAWQAGYSVVIVSTADSSGEEFGRAIDRIVDHGVDGVVLAAPITAEGLVSNAFHGIPAISVGDPVTGDFACPAVIADQHSGVRQAIEHLLSLGHRTVWHVAGPVSWYAANARIEGWREALQHAGAHVNEPLAGDWTARAGYQAGLELAERSDVTAVMAANDQMAIGLMRAFKEKGRQIPEDVSIVGFDDEPDSEFLMVPLTTVRQDFTAITHRAVTELVHAIAGEEFNRGVTRIPVDLMIRASSGPAPTPTSAG